MGSGLAPLPHSVLDRCDIFKVINLQKGGEDLAHSCKGSAPDLSTSFVFGSRREFHGNERKNVIEQTTYIMSQEARERDKFDGRASENSLAGTLLSDLAVSMNPCLPWISPFTPVPILGTKSLNHRPLGTFTSKLHYISSYMLPFTCISY